MTFKVPEESRVKNGPLASDITAGHNGAFLFQSVIPNRNLVVIASDGADWQISGLSGVPWEHVSVHVYSGKRQFTPTWVEMCYVKDVFWDAEDVVVQFHPRKSDYVNNHVNTLHLWRPVGVDLPTPPAETVGNKALGTIGGDK